MIQKIRHYLAFFILLIAVSSAQGQNANVRGLLTDEFNNPMANVKVTLAGTRFETISAVTGAFNFNEVPYGDYQLEVKENDYLPLNQPIKINQAMVDLGKVALTVEMKV